MKLQFIFLCGSAGAVLLWLGIRLYHRHHAPQEASMDTVLAAAQRGGYRLITTAELARRYRENPSDLLLVDTRDPGEFASGHIPGAVNFPLPPTWQARRRARKPLEKLLGPDRGRFVVFY
jgi:3-mercaptopyruvate sulfurtransferase SseA